MSLFRFGRKATTRTTERGDLAAATRASLAMGPWTSVLGQWQPRSHTPWLYEALREAVPVLDGGINRLVTIDGIVEVEGDNDRLVAEIEEWMRNVPVNDLETGYQAFYASLGSEHYEQGCGIGEFVYDARGRDVIGLRVADSKGVMFARQPTGLQILYQAIPNQADRRPDGMGTVEQLLRGGTRGDVTSALLGMGYVELDPAQLVIALNQPEADNPYGTSILRSLPFVAQILLKMQNATGRAWERFGDPPFHVSYATKNRKIDQAEAFKRATKIVKDLGVAMTAKARGNSVDLATGSGADDEIKIDVIGANGIAMEIEMPGRHMLEQVVAGFGLAPWMMGITWSQASGIGEQQSVVVLQESQTRFQRRLPGLRRPIEAMLRARGRAWKAGDWKLVQRLPNLMDEQKRAQAEFLRAQTALMLGEAGRPQPVDLGTGIDNNLRSAGHGRAPHTHAHPGKGTKAADDDEHEPEPFAEEDPELSEIEARTTAAMVARWSALSLAVLEVLELVDPTGEVFQFDPERLPRLLSAGETAASRLAAELLTGQMAAAERGVANAGLQITADFDDPAVRAAIERVRARLRAQYAETGLALVRGGIARRYRGPIVAQLAAGVFDGMNPVNVAQLLRRQFGAGEYNWERLARSELAMAQAEGKRDMLLEQGEEMYDFSAAAGACPLCLRLEAGGPYRLNDPSAPLPGRDTHPNCRCTILPRV